jgi:hypothetical protein
MKNLRKYFITNLTDKDTINWLNSNEHKFWLIGLKKGLASGFGLGVFIGLGLGVFLSMFILK